MSKKNYSKFCVLPKRFSRGQVSLIDILVAVIIFVFIFTALRGVWISNYQTATEEFELTQMRMSAISAADLLVKTGGYPADWTPSDVELPGLAKRPFVLSDEKVSDFNQLVISDYNHALSLLGLGRHEFNFALAADNPDYSFSLGKSLDNSTALVAVNRIVSYKGGFARVTLTVFSE